MYKKLLLAGGVLAAVAVVLFPYSGQGAKETVMTAFERANFTHSSCHIYREGYLNDDYYMIEEKKDFLMEVGKRLQGEEDGAGKSGEEHLKSGNSVVYEWTDKEEKECVKLTFLTKETEKGSCEISQENYLRAEIYLQNGVNAGEALEKQKCLGKATEECGLEEPVYVEIEGAYEGKMSRDDQRNVVEQLLDGMNASLTDSVDEEGLYTVYAYAKGAGETKEVLGKQVNLNLAVTYDEEADRTVFHLGCPIIGTDY